MIEFLTNDGDNTAASILRNNVFVFIPMLNPDGVVRGYHKLDALGQDLNRCYHMADFELQPQIYAVRQILQ